MIQAGQTKQAEEALAGLEEAGLPIPDEERNQALYLLGLGYLDALDFASAASVFGRIPPRSGPGLRAAFLARECRKAGGVRRDSPALAALLSFLLPGAGQLYLGRPADAARAAGWTLVPAALAGLGLWAGSWLVFVPAGLVALAFYGGTIYNALNQAHRGNGMRLRRLAEELKRQASALPGGP